MRKFFTWFVIILVAFVAYTYGAKAGRGRYREISAAIDAVWNDPKIRKARRNAVRSAEKAAASAAKRAGKLGR